MFGFQLAESMTGSWHSFADALVDRAVHISLQLTVDGLRRFALRRSIDIEGTIYAEGLAENRALTGAIRWRLLDENRVPYELEFDGDDGQKYRLRGQRDFFYYNAIGSLRKMDASLFDGSDVEVGRAVLMFEPQLELPALIKSFRPKLFKR